jgi:hypothetical protein
MHQENISNFFLDTINKGALLWISSSFEFLCVYTLTYLPIALVNNKTSSLLDFFSDGTTNISIADLHTTNLAHSTMLSQCHYNVSIVELV